MRVFAAISRNMEAFKVASEIEVLQVLKILGDIYPSFKLSSTAIEIYVQLLEDIPGMILGQCALDHISRSSFFPSIAELRIAAFSILEAMDHLPSGYEAWAEVQAEIQHIGYLGSPCFQNRITKKVVDQLGWRNLCLSDNQVGDRIHFIQSYQSILEQERADSRRLQVVNEFIKSFGNGKFPELSSGEQEGG